VDHSRPPPAVDKSRGEKHGFIPILNLLGQGSSLGCGSTGKALSHDANLIKDDQQDKLKMRVVRRASESRVSGSNESSPHVSEAPLCAEE
jgi:hypothetical protein